MTSAAEKLRRDALAIWRASVEAVESDRLVRRNVRVDIHADGRELEIGGRRIDLNAVGRIVVVGAGKAGAGMAAGFEAALGGELLREKQVSGWINVPADCARKLERIHLHAARPAGVNEPTAEGVEGSRTILRLVSELDDNDLCVALVSGGGSALLPLPIAGITLDDKLAVTRFLSAAGAPIDDLNAVRKALSDIKGGKLARACRAGTLVTLVISDVLGDPLATIASGPTIVDETPGPETALTILERYGVRDAGISPAVFETLSRAERAAPQVPTCAVTNVVIGNNLTAVEAAAGHARALGYRVEATSAHASEGAAEEIGRQLAERALAMRNGRQIDCLISGGEPTVRLVDCAVRGTGGRNQQLVLAAVERLEGADAAGVLVLSGGTDGEDGPTDAAGAFADAAIIEEAQRRRLEARDYLRRNDAYHWFEPIGGLIKTGPTDTNVCDVRVVLVDRAAEAP